MILVTSAMFNSFLDLLQSTSNVSTADHYHPVNISTTLPTLLHLKNSFRPAHLIFLAFLKSLKMFLEIGSGDPKTKCRKCRKCSGYLVALLTGENVKLTWLHLQCSTHFLTCCSQQVTYLSLTESADRSADHYHPVNKIIIHTPPTLPTPPTLGFGCLEPISKNIFCNFKNAKKIRWVGQKEFWRCRSVGSVGDRLDCENSETSILTLSNLSFQ